MHSSLTDLLLQGRVFFVIQKIRPEIFTGGLKMVLPKLNQVKEIVKDYSLIPLCKEIYSDVKTPIQVLKSLKEICDRTFLFESVEGGEKWGRYSFLGVDPEFSVSCNNGEILKTDYRNGVMKNSFNSNDPKKYLRSLMKNYKSATFEYLPRFTGGLAGYISYDFIKYTEPSLSLNSINDAGHNDFELMFFDKIIVFDHLRQKILVIVNIPVDDIEMNYQKGVYEIEKLIGIIMGEKSAKTYESVLLSDFREQFSKEEFCQKVLKVKKHIFEGDIFQAVISNRLTADFKGDLLSTYRVLRTINPSPYMFYISFSDLQIAGASPETLIRLTGKTLETFPIAGTRPRGETAEQEDEIIEDLLSDEKELAEHTMLVDLGRNDLGKISRFGSVKVSDYKRILKFSHVIHLGSHVTGTLRKEFDLFDAIGAVLPAGTLSGAPKKRACEIIDEMENSKRGIYGGAIGYMDLNGNMDFCIAIRMAVKKDNKVYVQSGAGIVADSVPEKEYEECIHKSKAVISAIQKSGEVM